MSVVMDSDRPDLGGNLRHGDINTFCPKIWEFLIERYSIRSMLDVGCGEGHAVAFFRRKGIIAHGVDGLLINVKRAVTPISLLDICTTPFVMPVDMVWSCEVAEHIPAEFVQQYLNILANAPIIAMTAAIPGQDGHNHVNCQPPEYWIEKMKGMGYALSPDMEHYKKLSKEELNYTYFQRSGFVFVRK